MENIALIIILIVILGLCIAYIYKAKKRGDKCIGCPHSKECKTKSCNNIKNK